MSSAAGREVRDVWRGNLPREFDTIASLCRGGSPCIAIDAEFPGFLRSTPRWSSEEVRYADVRHNVDQLKLVQLGLTLFGDNTETCSWQFNLREFDPESDVRSQPSVDLLKKSGIDFDEFRRQGVDSDTLSDLLRRSLFATSTKRLKLITFHGLYDVAYLVKLITRAPLPETLEGFVHVVRTVIGDQLYDIKQMMTFCEDGSLSEMGLVRLSKELGVRWEGENHLAGHDSLLTALVFKELRTKMFNGDRMQEEGHAGVLYSIVAHCVKARKRMMEMLNTAVRRPPAPPRLCFVPCPPPVASVRRQPPRPPPFLQFAPYPRVVRGPPVMQFVPRFVVI